MVLHPEPRIIAHARHSIPASSISANAIQVLDRIRQAGYESYLVGGCVRDLMLGLHPKDFDVATDARPEEVRRLFRRARLIGRRFRLTHVRCGREVIEVATFRCNPKPASGEYDPDEPWRRSRDRVLSDNIYGTRVEDAQRRDFTVNALYYDVRDESVIDDVGGAADLERRLLRMIGDAESRYREDPVRMLRAIRFAVKLGFEIEPDTAEPIHALAPLLAEVHAARMFDEFFKLFHGGCALETYRMLVRYGLFQYLSPAAAEKTKNCKDEVPDLFERVLANTDARVRSGKPVIVAFLFAGLLWRPVCQRARELIGRGVNRPTALQFASADIIEAQARHVTIPRRVGVVVREIWELQARLERRDRKWVDLALGLQRFRAAYDFLLLRGEVGEVTGELCDWWTRFQEVGERGRRAMIRSVPRTGTKRRRGRAQRYDQQSERVM